MAEMPFSFERMQWQDVPEVMVIERRSFTLPWSANAYRHEILENANAHYFVLRRRAERPDGWLSRLMRRAPAVRIVGYGGFWFIVDEAHVSTIAIDVDWRSRGLGEYLLASMIGRAIALRAASLTLEVREGNLAAQSLYRKYGFVVTGRRPRYYQDNHENALLMTVADVNTPAYQQTLSRLAAKASARVAQPNDRSMPKRAMRHPA